MSKFKLLTKREVDLAKSKDRQQEVAEGAKLAKRVDELRKTVIEEEARIEQFRKSVTSQVNREIASLLNQRDMLREEIQDLEALLEHRNRIKHQVEDFLQEITK